MRIWNLLSSVVILISLLVSGPAFSQAFPSDAQLSIQVKKLLAGEASLSNASLRVSAIEGIVKLSGQLDSEDQIIQAIHLTQSIPGVKDVDVSELRLKGNNPPLTDAIITAKIEGVFMQNHIFGDQDLSDMDISIETHQGIVTITGTADNGQEVNNMMSLASAVRGVIEVKMHVKQN